MRYVYLHVVAVLLFVVMSSVEVSLGATEFALKDIAHANATVCQIAGGAGFEGDVLKITPVRGKRSVTIWQQGGANPWTDAVYLVIEMWHDNQYSGVLNIDFFQASENRSVDVMTQSGEVVRQSQQDQPRISPLLGILPRLKTKIVFPLHHLDAQEIFLKRFPRQLKGTVSGDRLDPEDIERVALRFGPYYEPYYTPQFEIKAIYLTTEPPKPYPKPDVPVADEFGQWARRDWPGKVKTEAELKAINQKLLADAKTATYPEQWSQYGGWKAKQYKATGFFRTEKTDQRWWLIDPEGYPFISMGVTCIGPGVSGTYQGQEDLYGWVPDKDDPLYRTAFGGRQTMVDFHRVNMQRVFGESWYEQWAEITKGLFKTLSLNTVANWSDLRFARQAKLPYVLPLGGFPSTQVSVYRDFPDVFSPEYQANAERFAAQLESYKDDPYLIGYFLRNEPHWAFGYHNLAFEMFATTQDSATKQAFIVWLKKKYNEDVTEFNRAWHVELPSFDVLASTIFKAYPSDQADQDCHAFSEIMVRKYVDVPCDAVEKVDANHLNLGMRYAWISSDLLYKAGERFDVFSINGYGNPGPPPTEEIARRSGKPVMIGEFHFGATDRGLPATGIQGVLTQADRAKAYRYYVEQGLTRPELVGMHYFQWNDQAILGRFDGENYNIGVVDICNRPYPELTEAMKTTHDRMYELATGQVAPFAEKIEKLPPIHY